MGRSPSRSSDGGSEHYNERLEPRLLKAIERASDCKSEPKNQTKGETYQDVIELAKHHAKHREDNLGANEAEQRSKASRLDTLLRIGLRRAAERVNVPATRYFLDQGAKPDGAPGPNRVSPLLLVVDKEMEDEQVPHYYAIVQLLLAFGANPDTTNKKGRTVLMTAAWRGHYHIMDMLLKKGANVNAKDNTRRNILHNLAADPHPRWGEEHINLLLATDVAIDGPDGQDELKRSPLHWACVTGKRELAKQLLTRSKYPGANVNAVEMKDKTPLHLAAAHGRDDIVELLLKYGADVNAKSDGAWRPLHNVCQFESTSKDESTRLNSAQVAVNIVRMLLDAGSELNARLLNGKTPLHVAAESGHIEVIRYLLQRKDIKRAARDSFGVTPFLRAAHNKRKDVVNLLAPFNNVESLSEDALGACNGFNATICDFGNFHNGNRVQKRTVYELLYGRDTINPRKPAINILPRDTKIIDFRWIHLPANNMAWIEALLTKAFIEEGASDVDGFKALERSFTHQHRGRQVHSHFMRTLCQSTPRAPRIVEESDLSDTAEQGPPQIIINGSLQGTPSGSAASSQVLGLNIGNLPQTPTASKSQTHDDQGKSTKEQGKGWQKEKGKKPTKGGKPSRDRPETPSRDPHPRQRHQRKSSQPLSDSRHLRSPGSPGRKDPTQVAKGNIFTFMPYLHFETNGRRKEMQEAISRTQEIKNHQDLHIKPPLCKATTYDEMLLRAHLSASHYSLHVRRTLDQSFYHNIVTESRDQDQVVYRYQCRDLPPEAVDPKIFMVDQLWMWVLGKDLIVTGFPQRWQQPKNDPLNVLDGIIEDINSKTREPVRSVYDLAMLITNRCSGVFDRHRMGEEEYQFLDMFEASIGEATDKETELFKEFNGASAQASAWLKHHQRPNRFSRHLEATSRDLEHTNKREARDRDDVTFKEERFKYEDQSPAHAPLFVDKLLDIGKETTLLSEIKDIRDELNMIKKVLDDQKTVLPDLEIAILDIYKEEHRNQQEVKRRFRDQMKTVETHINDLLRMDTQAERIYSSIRDLLDLKQKHANAFEARFARDQAAGTARQSQTIMVFTIVTIVFLPLSFIAAFFTINIQEFPRDTQGNESLPLGYVSKYMFGIGFAVSIPLIAIALSLDAIGDYFREMRRRWRNRGHTPQSPSWKDGSGAIGEKDGYGIHAADMVKLEEALSAARSVRLRNSMEPDLVGNHLLPITSRETSRSVRAVKANGAFSNTGFRIRTSRDVERGL